METRSAEGDQKIIDMLSDIITELDARNSSGNCVVAELQGKSWNDLCVEGMKLFQQLGG